MMTYEEIKSRCDKATPGPWDYLYTSSEREVMGDDIVAPDGTRITKTDCRIYPPQDENAEFIAHARTDVPLLLKALEIVCERTEYFDEDPNRWNYRKPDYWLEQAQEGD